LLLGIILYAGYRGCEYFQGPKVTDATLYVFDGKAYSVAHPDKPLLLAIWVEGCAYDQNKMAILSDMRRRYPADKLDVIGIYMGQMSESDLNAYADRGGYQGLTLVSARQALQKSPELSRWLSSLHDPANNVYLIKQDGRAGAFAASDSNKMFPPEDVEPGISAEVDKL
jgi:hypothetical protein